MTTTPPSPASREQADRLVTEHLGLVQHVVNQVAARYPRHVDRQELWNAGAYGLVDASRRFDESQGIPFPRYAMIRIRGAIIDSTRSRDWVTRAARRGMREIRDATDALIAEHGRAPSEGEIAERLDIEVDRLREMRSSAAHATLLHLDQRVGAVDTDEMTLADLVEEEDEAVLPGDALENRELTGTLRLAVRHLPQAQREVVTRYYFGGEYLRDIADSLGVTEARASQIRSEGLTAIRAYFARAFDGVPAVDDDAPGRRNRLAFLAGIDGGSTWRDRLDEADRPLVAATA
ncbi:MAG: sigma-70 family RNA polymerase sigma factor [Actinobacteria bacterium]|nr:sigma-70 family RNA polymerase sigma factor [Actinomycetota bacterium]